jgi:hypothetical protein
MLPGASKFSARLLDSSTSLCNDQVRHLHEAATFFQSLVTAVLWDPSIEMLEKF